MVKEIAQSRVGAEQLGPCGDDSARLDASRSARPSRPTSGLCAFTWKRHGDVASRAEARRGASASTRSGSPGRIFRLNAAVGDTCGSWPRPEPFGTRVTFCRCRARGRTRPRPAPASSSTDTTARSMRRRAISSLRHRLASVWAQAPPSGHDRRPRNAASANGTGSPTRIGEALAWITASVSLHRRSPARWHRPATMTETARPRHGFNTMRRPARGSPRACAGRSCHADRAHPARS